MIKECLKMVFVVSSIAFILGALTGVQKLDNNLVQSALVR
jgi:hypothetical protein